MVRAGDLGLGAYAHRRGVRRSLVLYPSITDSIATDHESAVHAGERPHSTKVRIVDDAARLSFVAMGR